MRRKVPGVDYERQKKKKEVILLRSLGVQVFRELRVKCFNCSCESVDRDSTRAEYAADLHEKGWRTVEVRPNTFRTFCWNCAVTPAAHKELH